MKFQPPKGTRDFLPEEMIKREYVIDKIKDVFFRYGFEPMDTPLLENFELLAVKGGVGDEVRKQVFNFEDKGGREIGLRPELTIGTARVIATNPQLPKPFKRCEIAPVWRYEEVTAGRKREFYQCDIDIFGVESKEAEVECISCAVDCLRSLGFEGFEIRISSRKILEGFIELIKKKTGSEEMVEFSSLEVFRAIDKLGKIGVSGVRKELEDIRLKDVQIESLLNTVSMKGKFEEVLKKGLLLLKGIKIAEDGLKEMEELFGFAKLYGIDEMLQLDFGLARGLDYYTGPIFEIAVKTGRNIGSIAGGGRYDKLIGLLGGRETPAVGISLGIERIIEVMKDEKMFDLPQTKVKVFIANIGDSVKGKVIGIAKRLRENGISCQTDLMNRNLGKQLEYADSVGIPYVIVVGEKELQNNKFKLKDMKKKSESEMDLNEIIRKFSK